STRCGETSRDELRHLLVAAGAGDFERSLALRVLRAEVHAAAFDEELHRQLVVAPHRFEEIVGVVVLEPHRGEVLAGLKCSVGRRPSRGSPLGGSSDRLADLLARERSDVQPDRCYARAVLRRQVGGRFLKQSGEGAVRLAAAPGEHVVEGLVGIVGLRGAHEDLRQGQHVAEGLPAVFVLRGWRGRGTRTGTRWGLPAGVVLAHAVARSSADANAMGFMRTSIDPSITRSGRGTFTTYNL